MLLAIANALLIVLCPIDPNRAEDLLSGTSVFPNLRQQSCAGVLAVEKVNTGMKSLQRDGCWLVFLTSYTMTFGLGAPSMQASHMETIPQNLDAEYIRPAIHRYTSPLQSKRSFEKNVMGDIWLTSVCIRGCLTHDNLVWVWLWDSLHQLSFSFFHCNTTPLMNAFKNQR